VRFLHHAGRRALILTCLLAVSLASAAQSGSGATESEADADSSETWRSDLKAPLRPADDVGGSWNAMLLYGQMTDAALVDVFLFNFGWADAKLLSGEVGYTLKEDNGFQRFMSPVLNNIDVALNVTYQDDPAGTIFVFSPFVMARWNNFPWSNTIRTTFGLGGGLSYATDIPSIEIDSTVAARLPPAPPLRCIRPDGGGQRGQHGGPDRHSPLLQVGGSLLSGGRARA
jgi:hypothetical protein